MGKKGGATPVVDKSKASEANLNVIKRIDPDVEEVLASSGHVCLYRMSVDDQQWQRKNVEGALFLVRRRAGSRGARHQLVVLNKVSAANHAEDVTRGMELEVNAPYLMYTYGDDEVHGVWFYEKADLERVGKMLRRLLASMPSAGDEGAGAAEDEGAAMPSAAAAQAPVALTPPARARAGDDGAFWDRQVSVTEASIPPGHGTMSAPPRPPMQQQASSSGSATVGGLDALLRQAQAKAGPAAGSVTPGPPPPQQPQPQQPQPAPPALLTPSFLLASAAAGRPPVVPSAAAAVPPPPAAPANGVGGGTLQALLARAARPPVPAPAPAPPLSPYAPVASGPPPSTPPFGGAGGGPGLAAAAATRERLRAALQRALQRDEVVDALAAELRAAGLLV